MSDHPLIKVEPSKIYPGRFSFYINGERRGSAPTRAAAKRAAEELVAQITLPAPVVPLNKGKA